MFYYRPDFPHYYEAIAWSYRSRRDFSPSFKRKMERGVNENTTAEVSLTYFFTLKTYRQIALASKFGAALVVSYITEVWYFVHPKCSR